MFKCPTLVASLAAGCLIGVGPMLGAQSKDQVAQLPKSACSPVLSVVSIRIVDAAGEPIRNATVELTRMRDGKNLGRAVAMSGSSGDFQVVESTALAWIAPRGDRIRVVARASGKRATAIVRVGRDLDGCRLVRISGPDVLSVK